MKQIEVKKKIKKEQKVLSKEKNRKLNGNKKQVDRRRTAETVRVVVLV